MYIHIYILSIGKISNILTCDSYDIVIDLNSLHATLSSLVKRYKTTIALHYLKKM